MKHVVDYTTALMHPWQFPHRLNVTEQDKVEDPIQSTIYNEAVDSSSSSDQEHPYIQEDPFQLDPRLSGGRPFPHLGKTMLPA